MIVWKKKRVVLSCGGGDDADNNDDDDDKIPSSHCQLLETPIDKFSP